MWTYIRYVLIPYQEHEAAQKQRPRGNLSDLYPRWLGARELLLRGRDPYSAAVTRDIQIGYYGRQLDPKMPNDLKDQQGFAYPLYVVWMLAPTIKLPFGIVQPAFFVILMVLTAGSVLLWINTLGWRLPFDQRVAWVVLAVSCLPAVQGLKLQQLTLLVAALIAACVSAISRGRLVWAGVFLAFATIKPQLIFLLVVWLCIWVSGHWRERWGFISGFGVTMCLLIGASEVLLPGWIHEFRAAMQSYYQYAGGARISLIDLVFTPIWGRIVSLVLVGILIAFLWKVRGASADAPEFTYSVSFTLATTLLVIPMLSPYNQILLVAPVMMLMHSFDGARQKGRVSLFFLSLMKVAVFWPFFSAALLVLAIPFLPSAILDRAARLPFYSTLAVPITVYAALLIRKTSLLSEPTPVPGAPEARILRQGAAAE